MRRSATYRIIFEFFLDPEVYRNRQHVKTEVFGANVLARLGRAISSMLGNLYLSLTDRPAANPKLKQGKWLIAGTRNQEVSLDFLRDHGFQMVPANFYTAHLPAGRINWYRLPKVFYFFHYLGFLLRVARKDWRHFSRIFQELIHGVGVYENQLLVLRQYQPEVIVISNDIMPWFRSLTLAARQLNIPTVYLQHATVGKDFSPLIVDLALLEGQDTLDKYTVGKRAPEGAVEIVGMARFEPYAERINTSTRVERVGVAVSLADEPAAVVSVVERLLTLPGLQVTVRQHPRDTRSLDWQDAANLHHSDARKTPALSFLAEQDLIIAGETGIHLEAALLNVSSVYFQFSTAAQPPVDSYGFLAQGLMPAVPSAEALLELVQEWQNGRPPVKGKAAYYVANADPQFTGSSQQRVLAAIAKLLKTVT